MKDRVLRQEARDFDRIYKERSRGVKSILVAHDERIEYYFYKNPWRYDFSRQYAFGNALKDLEQIVRTKKNINILDIGCGNGWFSLNANIRNRNHWDCIDLSKRGILTAEKYKSKLVIDKNSYFYTSLENYNVAKKYDVITCVNTLHHLRNLETFFKKVRAHLKHNGTIFIHDVSSDIFSETNGAFVLLLRTIFNFGNKIKYFEGFKSLNISKRLEMIIHEWQNETDEGKQSYCDHRHSSEEIKSFLCRKFRKTYYKEEGGILMRFLGGLRGKKRALRKISRELIDLEKTLLMKKIIAPYTYTFIGKLK